MNNSTNILDRFEYINLPNFYVNRYEIILIHSFTTEEDGFISITKDEFEDDGFISITKDEFEDDILLQLVLLYINNSTVDINKNKKLPWLYDYLVKYDLLPSNGKVYPNFCIISINMYYYELGDKFYVKIPSSYNEKELEELEENINCIYQKSYNL